MIEIELWDGTKKNPDPIAKLGVKDDKLKIIASERKVKVRELVINSLDSEFKKRPEKLYSVYITNLSMQVSRSI